MHELLSSSGLVWRPEHGSHFAWLRDEKDCTTPNPAMQWLQYACPALDERPTPAEEHGEHVALSSNGLPFVTCEPGLQINMQSAVLVLAGT